MPCSGTSSPIVKGGEASGQNIENIIKEVMKKMTKVINYLKWLFGNEYWDFTAVKIS